MSKLNGIENYREHEPKRSIMKQWENGRSDHLLCLGFLQLKPWLEKKKKKNSSCILCHHMHEKGPSNNIFLSFQAISLIPDELQGRGKHYGCGLAGGKEGILWLLNSCVGLNVCLCEHGFIWIHLHYWEYLFKGCLLSTFLFTCSYLGICVCV